MKKFALTALVLLAVAVAIWLTVDKPATLVSLAKVERGTVQSSVSNTRAGTVKSCRRSKLSMPVGGRVAKLMVDEGDKVAVGQPLLELWNEDQKARRAQSAANLEAVRLRESQACLTAEFDKREARRLEQLATRNLASEETVDNAQTRSRTSNLACQAARAEVQTAQANLDLQQSLLDLTVLKAPFSGVVAEINGEIGEYVTPSPPGVATPPAVDLIDTECLYVTAPIDEVDAGVIRVGLVAEISLDAFPNRVFAGQLTRIAPYVLDFEKQARTVAVDVKFLQPPEDVALLVGYSADMNIVLQVREKVLRIPTETVFEDNRVWRYAPQTGVLEQVEFKPGLSNWSYTEVLEGLAEGDQILLSLDVTDLKEGMFVAPRND